ncbi:MAG: response regulator [Gracilibacteraceae bacterium]|jgi:signal transduction histidine kinase/DNA-binding response OmpR family regulator|nr:response regulator [Gracilibacteraceae bacterium]
MSIRLKVFFVIVSIVAVITAANMGMGTFFTQDRLLETVESDMSVVADIADKLITSQINLLKANASAVANRLQDLGGAALRETLTEQVDLYENFMGLSVFDREGLVDAYGYASTAAALLSGEYMARAFAGEMVISTTCLDYATQKQVFLVCVPMTGDRVLSVTVSGHIFSDLLRDFKVWKTGSIFILDAKGTMVANYRDELVEQRSNFIEMAKTDPALEELGEFSEKMIGGGRGAGRYVYQGTERLCVYTPITGSKVGWVLAVAAPLAESPAARARKGLLLASLVFLLAGILIAAALSGALARPFQRIEEQNVHLAELNEIAQSASEAKSRFLANMSHEMRTPLNAVVGLSELMLDAEEPGAEETGDNLGKIHTAGMTLLSIVNDILDISKIESGKFELMPAEYDLPSLINDTVTLNIMRVGDKPIRFQLEIDGTLPSRLFGDELRIKQICNNLISNALKYTKEGSVTWSLACERDEGGVWLTARVADTGIGIRPEDLKKLFSEYNQVDTRSNRRIEGTGLGLSIAKMMAEMMDGAITVESEFGKGSVFTVRLRQGHVTDVPIGAETAENLKRFHYCDNKRSSNAKLTRIRLPYAQVLVVDDVQTNLDVAKGMMKPYGMRIDCVTGGRQAVARIREAKVVYNAIFMDHMMPEMDGIEATRVIREEIGTEYARNIPIIALTANAIIGNEKIFLEKGFQAFISKPIDIMQLDAVVRQWLRNKDLEKEAGAGETAAAADEAAGAEAAKAAAAAGGLKIDGVDAEKCLSRFGGDMDTCLQVLRSYAANTGPLLERMRGGADDSEQLAAYAVVAHGIKGSSRGICAEGAGEMAEALELAAKAGDTAFIRTYNADFIRAAETLLENLRRALDGAGRDGSRPRKAEPEAALLHKLRICCETYDMDGADAIMEELERFDYERRGELTPWLRERIDRMEFAEILAELPGAAA